MAKCKVCGSRLTDGITKCPMCGAALKNTEGSSLPCAVQKQEAPRTLPANTLPASTLPDAVYEEDDMEISSADLIAYGNSLLVENPPPSAQREAFRVFYAALDMGDPLAHLFLGYCYLDGIGTEKDEEEAYAHFSEAHYADIHEGTTMMGFCHYFGLGVRQNPRRGKELLESAKQRGDESAKVLLKRIKRDEKRDRVSNAQNAGGSDDSTGGEGLLLLGAGAALLGGILGSLLS